PRTLAAHYSGYLRCSVPQSGTRPALFDDLRIARMARGARSLQDFLTFRKRPEFLFLAQVLFAGLRSSAHAGKAMMFRGHRPIFGRIDHRSPPTQVPFARTAPERTAWDAQKGSHQ